MSYGNETYLENIYVAANQYAFITWSSFLPETKENNTLPMKFKYSHLILPNIGNNCPTSILQASKPLLACEEVSLYVHVCPLSYPAKIERNDDENLT